MSEIEIEQKRYGTIIIDTTEKDTVQIWIEGGMTVIKIERESLKTLLSILIKEIP